MNDKRGLAGGRHQPDAEEDASYVHHVVAVSLDAELMPHLELE